MLNENEVVENTAEEEEISQEEENPEQTDDASTESEEIKAKEEESTKTGKEFTSEQQARINELIRTRLDRQKTSAFKRYGVKDENELDDLLTKGQSYRVMKDKFEARGNEIAGLQEKLAFLENNINPERYDDVRVYFKGKGIKFDNDSLIQELATHPEWLNTIKQDTTPKTTITKLGVEHGNTKIAESEDERMARVFGLK